MVVSPNEQQALVDFAKRVRAHFGNRVTELSLFGSRARGTDVHEDSDIDVCVAISGLDWTEKAEVFSIAGAILEERDVVLSVLLLSGEHLDELRKRERALAEDLARDGIPL